VLKTVNFLLQMGFARYFVTDCSFKLCFWQFKLWHRFSTWLHENFVLLFKSLDGKFNEDSKNVLKTVIFSLQVGFKGRFVIDCLFKLCFYQFILWYCFSPWLYQILKLFLHYWIGNLMRIPKICLKMWFGHYKLV